MQDSTSKEVERKEMGKMGNEKNRQTKAFESDQFQVKRVKGLVASDSLPLPRITSFPSQDQAVL